MRITGSTGRRKGLASFSFLSVRIVDWQNFHCLASKDGGEVGTGVVAVDGGGGVADVFTTEALSASECTLGRLAGGG